MSVPDKVSVYQFSDVLSGLLSEGDLIVSGSSGTAVELFLLAFRVKEGQRVFPAFLEAVLHDFKIEGNKFHAAGMSNGGISAFYIAALYPQYFLSITGFPGYLPEATPASIHAIAHMCINMYVGGLDADWLDVVQQQAAQLRGDGLHVRFSVEPGQPHIIGTLRGEGAARLFDGFDEARHGCGR